VDKHSGSVERITFYNSENGYTVLRLRPEGSGQKRVPGLNFEGLATVIGSLPEVSPGEHLRLQGNWDTHPKHGTQFKVEVCEQTLPASVAGIEHTLSVDFEGRVAAYEGNEVDELFRYSFSNP
jgi:exodeoxyribonuclease V alpha subunit